MKKILIAYATMAGSTAEIAAAVAEDLTKCGYDADVLPMAQVRSLDGYDAVVLGAPMILGWHRTARSFLKKHRKQLQQLPFAVFALAMSLTKSGETSINGVPVWIDENLPRLPENPGKLSFREHYASLSNYIKPMVKNVHPATIGIFGGRMEYGRLKWWAVLFAMLIVQSPAGDKRNWASIHAWAASLPDALKL